MVVFFRACGAHEDECRPSVNNDFTTKNNAKHCEHVWSGPWYCFFERLGLMKASVDHPSILISPQKIMPSTVNMCGLGHGSVFSSVWGS